MKNVKQRKKAAGGDVPTVVESAECVGRDGRLGTTARCHGAVHGITPAQVFLGKAGTGGKNPQRALGGLAGTLGCCGNWKEMQNFKQYLRLQFKITI